MTADVPTGRSNTSGLRIAIDASNIRGGGGVTYLSSVLNALNPEAKGISEVAVWSGHDTLQKLPSRPWLVRQSSPGLNKSLVHRLWWHFVHLPALLHDFDVLYVPGGIHVGSFRPFVAISRNMLPFDPQERKRYGFSWQRLRLFLLRYAQTATFRRATATIFLTPYARAAIEAHSGPLAGRVEIIPHGVADLFRRSPRPTRTVRDITHDRPLRVLYVSTVDTYKHHDRVVEAVARVRQTGLPIELTMIGDGYLPTLRQLQTTIDRVDPKRFFIHHRPAVSQVELAAAYANAEVFVFASSCENMPNTLVEAMASGLPILCSDRPPMPLILGAAGVYFDSDSVDELTRALASLAGDSHQREQLAHSAFERALNYSWEQCADRTFEVLARLGARTRS